MFESNFSQAYLCGGLKRRSPTGGRPYGTDKKLNTSREFGPVGLDTIPWTLPFEVWITGQETMMMLMVDLVLKSLKSIRTLLYGTKDVLK